jgi:hypothetical protein
MLGSCGNGNVYFTAYVSYLYVDGRYSFKFSSCLVPSGAGRIAYSPRLFPIFSV